MFYLDDATRREAAAEMVEAINRCLEMSPAELAASGDSLELVVGRGKPREFIAAITGLPPEQLSGCRIEKLDVIFRQT